MRLIDADAVKGKLKGSRFKYIRNFLNRQPTIDAVPVVRCKDCTRYFEGRFGMGTCQILSERSDRLILGHQVKMPPDGFCYLGERKDGGGND